MADGGLTIELDEALAGRLKAEADALGRSVGDYASDLIARALEDDWAEDYARLAEYDRTGEFVDAATAMRDFREAVAAAVRAKRR